MSDRIEIMATCPNYNYLKKSTLYCNRTKPITFETRQELFDFMKEHCCNIHNNCAFNTPREKCCMENNIGTGRHTCSAYEIECHRATCPYYKSEKDKEMAELKTRERLLSLPEQQRKDIEEKYGLRKKKRGY